MIFFFIFISILSIYEIYYIIKNINDKKATHIIIYCVMAITVLGLGIYYNSNEYGNSLTYYALKILKIEY